MATSENSTITPTTKRKRVSRVERARQIWDEVEQAVRAVAVRRGWPHESFEDLEQVMRRLASEDPDHRLDIMAAFHCSLLYRDNIRFQFMDMEEIKFFQPSTKKFIKRLETL